MNIRTEAAKSGVIWAVLIIFMFLTRPANMPVYILFAPFVVLAFGFFSLWRLAVVIYGQISGKKGEAALSRKQRAAGIALSLLAVVIVGLQSIGEMTSRDVLTVTLLAVGAYFYFVRNLVRD